MAKKSNMSNSFDDMFLSVSETPSITPSEEQKPAADELTEGKRAEPQSANKRGRKPQTQATAQPEGKKTVTVYLNAENWSYFCLIAQIRKPSASAWLDELIAEEIKKNENLLEIVKQIK